MYLVLWNQQNSLSLLQLAQILIIMSSEHNDLNYDLF